MATPYPLIHGFVQHLAPTWRKTQHENLSKLIASLLERPSLCLSEIARGMGSFDQSLHGRLKRLMRFLSNPRLDEAALFMRWLRLSLRFGEDLPPGLDGQPVLPILVDTTYFDPFALLLASVPCGSRGLPVALTTYHRSRLKACLPPRDRWPKADEMIYPPRPRRGARFSPASSIPKRFLSQNQIESSFLDYVFGMISSALRPVLVADRGFARAELLRELRAKGRDFVIRMDAETHIRIPEPLAEGMPTEGRPAEVLGLKEGERVFCPLAWYGKEDQVPVRLLALYGRGYKEPWYIVSSMDSGATEQLYRWRMRLEATNRDEKTGVLLREGGDHHGLSNSLHFHRLMLALAAAEWLCALTGLQAWNDLPEETAFSHLERQSLPSPTDPLKGMELPSWVSDPHLDDGPASPPPAIPHRGGPTRLPSWLRPFAARGMLSYVRLGLEILRCPDPPPIVGRLLRWLAAYLWSWVPLWCPHQLRYRLRHWWTYDL